MRKTLRYLAVICITVYCSCQKSHKNPVPDQPELNNVYVYGTLESALEGVNDDAIYIKNGTLSSLNTIHTRNYTVFSFNIFNNTIYAAGGWSGVTTVEARDIYWINNTEYSLPIPQLTFAYISYVIPFHDSLYTSYAGLFNSIPISGVAVNGISKYTFTNITINGSIAAGNDYYIYGDTLINDKYYATYYKNGHPVHLTPAGAGKQSQITSMCVSGSDVYACGFVDQDAVFWKNGVMTTLSTGAYASGIAVKRTDIYVAGVIANGGLAPDQENHYAVAVLWKNGQATLLGHQPFDFPYTYNIQLIGNDIYVGGTAGADTSITIYWKNGKPIKYNIPRNSHFREAGIFVIPK